MEPGVTIVKEKPHSQFAKNTVFDYGRHNKKIPDAW